MFEFTDSKRSSTPLLLGVVGPSGSGKTYSSLRLASGIQTVLGGDIAFIDTEARRSLHYASKFTFKHLDFKPPHSPDRYLEAFKAAIGIGAKIICVDSMSHEHEGEGGVLEWHESELDRLAGDDWRKRDGMNFLAWAKPKASRRKLINWMLQQNVDWVLCFRAKEKIKLVKGKDGKTRPEDAGWQAIAGDEFGYECTDRFLLPPGANGVPDLSQEAWSTGVPKVPADHQAIVGQGKPLDEAMGASLARWAMGDSAPPQQEEKEFELNKALKALADLGVTRKRVEEFLGHAPTKSDRAELERIYRDVRRSKAAQATADQPGSVEQSTEAGGVETGEV